MPIVATGYDYAFNHPSETWLAANADFVIRYLYPRSQYDAKDAKNLSKTEADRLIKLGLVIVSNYEWYAERAGEGYAAGLVDAQAADVQHRDCGGPPGAPIYFSVDFDPPDLGAVGNYFRGAIAGIGAPRVGAYGGYKTIKYLFDNNLIKWGWQTYAWSGGRYDERCHLSQDDLDVSVGGGTADLDHAHTVYYGQWPGTTQEDDMPYTEDQLLAIMQKAVRSVLAVKDRMAISQGTTNNDNVFSALIGASQTQFNKMNQSLIQTAAILDIVRNLPEEIPPLSPEQVEAVVSAMTAAVVAGQPPAFTGTIKMVPEPPA
jgi:hypothetical protein